MRTALAAALVVVALAYPARAGDQYHVYELSNGECEVDTRSHEQMKSQRGTDSCLGHFDYRMDAEKRRKELVGKGACKCPSGQNC
jgi:hypothetical protein